MNAPPARCARCGWTGPAPGFHIANSTDVTFEGETAVTCPNCGQNAKVITGTYDFVDDLVHLVRDANLSHRDVIDLRRAAEQAREAGKAPEDFAAENPAVAPIINILIQQQRQGRDALVVFLMVLTILIPFLQSARYHGEDQHQQQAAPPPTTRMLRDHDAQRIANQLERKINPGLAAPEAKKAAARRKRPPKKYGKNKRRHR
jgi:hypothetical protein